LSLLLKLQFNNSYATHLLIFSNEESEHIVLCVVIIVIKCVTVSAYLSFRFYCRWFRLGEFLAFWTGVSQTTMFRVRELIHPEAGIHTFFRNVGQARRSLFKVALSVDFFVGYNVQSSVYVRTCVPGGRLVQNWYFQSRYN
jgi:hypothetical protein